MTTTMTVSDYLELNAILERAASQPDSEAAISDEHLVALQRRWTRALSARLDQTLEFAERPFTDAVPATWRELAAEQATLRRVLDVAEPHSAALRAAMSTEFRQLALAGGMVGVDDPDVRAARLGRAYRNLIRSGVSVAAPRPESDTSTHAA